MLVPKVSKEKKQVFYDKLNGIRERALSGESFEELAKQFSEDPGSAQDGGDVGFFKQGVMIKEFSDAAFALEPGNISDIVETVYGVHLIKSVEKRGNEVRARHILLRMESDSNDEKVVVDRLSEMRTRIVSGDATFEEMAREYSEDPETKDLGGKMKWMTKQFILNVAKFPSLYNEGIKLEKNGISEPFKSNFGFHIVLLEDYKTEHKVNLNYAQKPLSTFAWNSIVTSDSVYCYPRAA